MHFHVSSFIMPVPIHQAGLFPPLELPRTEIIRHWRIYYSVPLDGRQFAFPPFPPWRDTQGFPYHPSPRYVHNRISFVSKAELKSRDRLEMVVINRRFEVAFLLPQGPYNSGFQAEEGGRYGQGSLVDCPRYEDSRMENDTCLPTSRLAFRTS